MIYPTLSNFGQITVSAVFGNPDALASIIVDDIQEIHQSKWSIKYGRFKLEERMPSIPLAGSAHKKVILILKDQNYSFFTANQQDGWSSLAFRISKKINTKAFVFSFCRDEIDNPGRLFMAINNGNLTRSVSVIKEDKWAFSQKGDLIFGEKAENYNARQIRNRLTNEMLFEIAVSNKIFLPQNLSKAYDGILVEETN